MLQILFKRIQDPDFENLEDILCQGSCPSLHKIIIVPLKLEYYKLKIPLQFQVKKQKCKKFEI